MALGDPELGQCADSAGEGTLNTKNNNERHLLLVADIIVTVAAADCHLCLLATPVHEVTSPCRSRIATFVACWSVELQPTEFVVGSRKLIQTCGSGQIRFQISAFPWASSSFRPRRIRQTVAVFAPLSRSIDLKAMAVHVEYFSSIEPFPLAKSLGFLRSRKPGCKCACGTRRVLMIYRHRFHLLVPVAADFRFEDPSSTVAAIVAQLHSERLFS